MYRVYDKASFKTLFTSVNQSECFEFLTDMLTEVFEDDEEFNYIVDYIEVEEVVYIEEIEDYASKNKIWNHKSD